MFVSDLRKKTNKQYKMYSNQQQQYGTPQGGQYPGQYPSSGYPDSPPQYNPEAGFGDQFEGFSSKAVRLGKLSI